MCPGNIQENYFVSDNMVKRNISLLYYTVLQYISRYFYYVIHPPCTDCSENILGVRNTFCLTWALCVTADVRYGIRLDWLQNHNNWISTCAVCYLWLFVSGHKLPVQKLSTWVSWSSQHHDNPVGADYTGAFRSLSELTRWRKKSVSDGAANPPWM